LIASYEVAEKVQAKLRVNSKNPNFRFEFDGTNFGTKPHPNVETMYRQRGHQHELGNLTEKVANWQNYILGWMGDIEHTQILPALIAGVETFCYDELNRECLDYVIDGIAFRHAEQSEDTQSHWEVCNRTLTWVFNTHSSSTEAGFNVYPSGPHGYYPSLFKVVSNLGSSPATPVTVEAE